MLGLTTERLSANDDREIERAFNELANVRPDALLIGPGPLFDSQRNFLVALAAKVAIP
jgi:anthranilate/para-aminobenzoate synthase component II